MTTKPRFSSVIGLALVSALALSASPALAQTTSVGLGWYASTQPNIAGYEIHLGTRSEEYVQHLDVGLAPEANGVVRATVELELGTNHFIAISTYDSAGTASPFSSEILITAAQLDPTGTFPMQGNTPAALEMAENAAVTLLTGLSFSSSENDVAIDWPLAFGASRELTLFLQAGAEMSICDFEGDGVRDILLGNIVGSEKWRDFGGYAAQYRAFNHSNTNDYTLHRGQATGLLQQDLFIDTHSVCADLDGDGRQELIVSTDVDGENRIQIRDDVSTDFGNFTMLRNALGELQVGTDILAGGGDGAIRTAVGDIDGDGISEIVVTFAAPFADRILILDDYHHGFAPMESSYLVNGYIDQTDIDYANFQGTVVPMVMDLDEDGIEEIVIVYENENGIQLRTFDDAGTAFLQTY